MRSPSQDARSDGRARLALDHVGIAVEDLEAARATFARLLGIQPSAVEEVPGENVRVSFFDVGGVRLELLAPTTPDSPVGRFLAKGRRGVHHLALRVDGTSIDAEHTRLADAGVPLSTNGVTRGSEGSRVFFVRPEAACGVLLELTAKDGDGAEGVEK